MSSDGEDGNDTRYDQDDKKGRLNEAMVQRMNFGGWSDLIEEKSRGKTEE